MKGRIAQKKQELPLKVLIFSEKGAGKHYHGPGTSAYRLFSNDQQNRFSVDLAHHYPEQGQYAVFNDQHYIPKPKAKILRRFKGYSPSLQWINNNISNFDIFYGLMPYQNYLHPAILSEKLGCPSVIKIAAYKTALINRSKFEATFRIAQKRIAMLQKVSAIIAISKDIVDELKDCNISPDKIFYIPNGVNSDKFCPVFSQEKKTLRERLKIKNMLTIVFVGTVGKHKSPHLIIEALLKIKQKNGVDCQLLIIGPHSKNDAGYYYDLLKLVNQNKLQVKFIDHTTNIEDYYKASDIFCLPSSGEGMPNSLLEAMSTGLPSITTRVSGANDLLLHGKTGFFVEQVTEDLTEKILQYMSNSELFSYHGQTARKRILDDYSHEIILAKYFDLFSLLKKYSSKSQ